MATAREVMTDHAKWAASSDTLVDVARKMRDWQLRLLPIRREDERLVGVITDRDIVIGCVADDTDPAMVCVTALHPARHLPAARLGLLGQELRPGGAGATAQPARGPGQSHPPPGSWVLPGHGHGRPDTVDLNLTVRLTVLTCRSPTVGSRSGSSPRISPGRGETWAALQVQAPGWRPGDRTTVVLAGSLRRLPARRSPSSPPCRGAGCGLTNWRSPEHRWTPGHWSHPTSW